MKKIIGFLAIVVLLISCNKNEQGNMVVKVTIDGLKKGTLYLQKVKDSAMVSVDSVLLEGKTDILLSDDVESPEIYFLALDKIAGERISFFGEKGEITVNAKLEKFATSAKITGSVNHDLLAEHKAMAQKFNGKKLDLVVEKFEAQKIKDTALVSKINKEEKSLIRRKYYYTTNFAVLNAEHEVAPYLALTELYNANIKLLDTINNSLSKEVKASKYGKELDKFITEIKKAP
ncbi:MAG: thiol:disulfide interchange protein [Bacteroidetes bacterium HGW-Bacteroidetes-3]|nr:MAG: thiol:disulfide interchange protein [Bacteroidetes bacterium HGW-Bacteroidetes-3]